MHFHKKIVVVVLSSFFLLNLVSLKHIRLILLILIFLPFDNYKKIFKINRTRSLDCSPQSYFSRISIYNFHWRRNMKKSIDIITGTIKSTTINSKFSWIIAPYWKILWKIVKYCRNEIVASSGARAYQITVKTTHIYFYRISYIFE